MDTFNINTSIQFQKSLVIRKLDLGLCGWSVHTEGKTEILHGNSSPQLGGYYCFYFLLYITQRPYSFLFSLCIFWIVVSFWENRKEWEWVLEFPLICHLLILQIESLLQKLRIVSFYFFFLYKKLVMSLKLSLSNFPSFRFCMWSRLYCNFPSASLMQTGKTKWSSMTLVETTLNMIMSHIYVKIHIYDSIYIYILITVNYKGESDCLNLKVRNMNVFRASRNSLAFFL